jgi:ribosomal protein S18 acetylase RimI-like enzyme
MIRWKQHRDTNGIVELVRTQLVPISPWQHPKDHRLHSEITHRLRRGATLIAALSRRGPPLGFLHMEFHKSVLLIDLLAIDSLHQNRRWGTQLMYRAEHYGRNKGLQTSHIFVDEHNGHALRFYSRLGYHTLRYIPQLRIVEVAKSLYI